MRRIPTKLHLRRACVVVAAAAMLLTSGPSLAQQAVDDSVRNRPRPEFDPIGFELDQLFDDAGALLNGEERADPERQRGPLSSFVVLPKFELDLGHTSNLYRVSTDERPDYFTVARPSVLVRSDWENHRFEVAAEAGIGRYRDTPDEDFNDYRVEANGALQVDEDTSVRGGLAAEQSHEQRGDIDDPGSAFGPTVYDVYTMSVGGERRVPDGVLISPSYRWTRYRYDNNVSSAGLIDNSDRWRTEQELRLRLGYEFVPGTTLFVQPKYTWTVYRQKYDRNGFDRNSQILDVLAGVTWDASPVTFLEAGLGILDAQFDDPAFNDKSSPTALLKLTWNTTPLLTFKSSIDQRFNPTTASDIAGTIATTFKAGLDWEARYNIILGAGYVYRNEEYVDAVPEHSRSTNLFSLDARWLVSEYFYVNGKVSHESRSGDFPTDTMTDDEILMTIGAQL